MGLAEIRARIEASKNSERKSQFARIFENLITAQSQLDENSATLAGEIELVRIYLEPINDLLKGSVTAGACKATHAEIESLAGNNRNQNGEPPEETKEALKILSIFCR